MRAAITGLGAYASIGRDARSIWAAVLEGKTGIGSISRFDASIYASQVAAEIRDGEGPIAYAIAAAREAFAHAQLAHADSTARIALVVGTSAGPVRARFESGDHTRHDAVAARVAEALKINGARITVSTACASGNVALGIARELIIGGHADVVLAGGSDALMEIRFAGFHALGAISPQACAPFSTSRGMSLGEGAAFLAIEAERHAVARGAPILAELSGYGSSADGFHATAPDPRGQGMARSLSAALDDAQVQASQIELYNAHGTGTPSNDAAEWQAMLRVFGERARSIPMTAPKAIFGHTFGAAGALEAVLSVFAIREGVVPPTPTIEGFAIDGPHGINAAAVPAKIAHVVSHNAAFGGANATVVISARGGSARSASGARPVRVAATASASPDDAILGKLPVRALDPIARAMIAAILRAAKDAGFELGRRSHDRVGLYAGVLERPATSTRIYEDGFYDRGALDVSPEAFSRTVMCAPAGAAARVLALRGPTATLSSRPVEIASMMLAQRGDADAIFAGDASDEGATFSLLLPA